MDTTCTHCHAPDPTGSTLCVPCTTTLTARLQQLPRLFTGLGILLAPGASNGQGRGGKGGPAPLPLNGDMFDLRREFDTVCGWLSAVHDARALRAPRLAGDTLTRLHTAVAGLLAHMPWIVATWPGAGDLAGEIGELHRSASSVVDPDPRPRGRRIGHCQSIDTSGTICGAVLWLAPGEQVARCDWCSMAWPPATWMQLKAWQTENADAA
ncbi:hypothetical protein AMK23_26205 [Streptomyces sp. CB02130]|uniref:hypothetical protein n=1 Tax=Streptomyces sp. CB02130 TaxID=1703934 RepID=UPI00093F43D0|nr:hypothetical protein [Streptomyces sp. CB02130]OKJ24331.1 hypothetical protein AMK23_26205 [Streptomyces sp. CB02130]